MGFGECQKNCSRSVWKQNMENIPGLLCLTRWGMAKELRVHPPTTGDTSTQEREGWEYQEILLQSPQQRCLTSNGSREASSVWWSWPADTKCPRGVEKSPAGTSPGAAQHGRAMAGGRWVSLRSQGSLTPKVLTAGWLRDETFPVHWRTIRSLSRRAGGAAGAPQSCFLTGADSAQSTRSSIVHPVGSGTKKPLCWAELPWVAES